MGSNHREAQVRATLGKWFGGSLASAFAWTLAAVEQNDWMKATAFWLGVLLTVLSVISVCFDLRRKWRAWNKDGDQ